MRIERTQTPSIRARLGAVTVEFACAASAFFLLTFGTVEFARVSMLRNVADAVSYEAARSMIIPGADSSDGEETASRLLGSAGVRDFKIEVSPSVIAEGTSEVTVTTTIPIRTNSWGASLFFGSKEIKSTMSMLTERNPQEQIRSARLRVHDHDDGTNTSHDGSDDHDDDEDGGDSSSSSNGSPGEHSDGDHHKKKHKDTKGKEKKKNTGKKKKDNPGKDKSGSQKKKGSGGSSKKTGGGSSKSGGGSSSGGGHSI